MSLWQLDVLWHLVTVSINDEEINQETTIEVDENLEQYYYFSFEKHLSEFLYRNWDNTDLGKEYILYDEGYDEGKETALEYNTGEVGRIDLLVRDKNRKDWIVIELKRDRSSDQVVGQILRYMGWVKSNLANEGESVKGLIILGEANEKIRYALEAANADIQLYLYSIDFKLELVN